jgi:hypothetical protein
LSNPESVLEKHSSIKFPNKKELNWPKKELKMSLAQVNSTFTIT